jgi:hypothetical protein
MAEYCHHDLVYFLGLKHGRNCPTTLVNEGAEMVLIITEALVRLMI